MQFRTSIQPSPSMLQISYRDPILAMGSCFAENIGGRLASLKYQANVNPFGILFNPISIRNGLALLVNNYQFTENDLFHHNELWGSLQHHGRFSNPDKAATLKAIIDEAESARDCLSNAKVIMLTFGTAWVYKLKESGEVVANCHKLPEALFERHLLSVDEIVDAYIPLLNVVKKYIPDLRIILTVSPIRHLKDGLEGNQVSKSTLILAAIRLKEQLDMVHYFPAFEIMMDDLRDYRFYANDMVHPSELAIEYIWAVFEKTYLSDEDAPLRKRISKLNASLAHRPLFPQTEAFQKFAIQQNELLEQLKEELPDAEWE